MSRAVARNGWRLQFDGEPFGVVCGEDGLVVVLLGEGFVVPDVGFVASVVEVEGGGCLCV